MKASNTTFFLVTVLLLVWVVIGYTVYHSFGDSDTSHLPVTTKNASLLTEAMDTFSLLLNYTDPFSAVYRGTPKSFTVPTSKPMVTKQTAIAKQPVASANLPLKYMGMMGKAKEGHYSLLVEVNGADMLIKKGDRIEGYAVKRATEDTLELIKGSEVKTFTRQ